MNLLLAGAGIALAAALSLTACEHPHHNDPRLVCVRAHESATAGGYSAQNPTSSASGAYQYVDGTWRRMTAASGIGTEYTRAVHAPPYIQDAVALYTFQAGHGSAWRGTGCPGT